MSPCPFPATITITPRAPPIHHGYLLNDYIMSTIKTDILKLQYFSIILVKCYVMIVIIKQFYEEFSNLK